MKHGNEEVEEEPMNLRHNGHAPCNDHGCNCYGDAQAEKTRHWNDDRISEAADDIADWYADRGAARIPAHMINCNANSLERLHRELEKHGLVLATRTHGMTVARDYIEAAEVTE
jgi:hypothetical protein